MGFPNLRVVRRDALPTSLDERLSNREFISLATRLLETFLMSRTYCLLLALFLTILPTLHAEKIDHRNFAIDTCYPSPDAIRLAEGRTRAYWAKHAARFGTEPRFLAVETSKVFPGEVQDLLAKTDQLGDYGQFLLSRAEE